MSIAQTCIDKKIITYVLSAALLFGGIYAYTKIGRLEDPEFTIKCAQIITMYPGATAEEVLNEVTDPIEIAVQQLGELDKVTSTSYAGRSIVMVEMKDNCLKADLPQVWDKLRHKVGDMQNQLPPGCSTPLVYDDFGDVYGVLYAIYGDGYSMADLKDYAKTLRRELLQCDDVAKIELLGDRTETLYLEIPRARLAALGISPSEIAAVISGQNDAAKAGDIRIGDKYIRISPAGKLASVEDLGELLIVHTASDGTRSSIRLKEIATIRRGYDDPPSAILRYNGHPCIGLGISTVSGGNVMVMGASIDKRLAELLVLHECPRRLVLRMGGFVGPGLRKNAVRDVLSGGPLFVNPASAFQFMHTHDLARAAFDLYERPSPPPDIVNVSARGTATVAEIAAWAGRELPPEAASLPVVHAELNLELASSLRALPDTASTVRTFVDDVLSGRVVLP